MKHLLSAFIFLTICFTGNAVAQKDTTISWLDSALYVVPKSKAICFQKIYFKDGLWRTIVMYRFKPYKIMTGSYADKKLNTAEGEFTYYLNDSVIKQGTYHNGLQDGIWKTWATSGLLADSVVFRMANILTYATFKYYDNGRLMRADINLPGNEKVKRDYDTNGVMIAQSRFKGYDGEMYTYYLNSKVKYHSVYKGGQRVLIEQFDDKGNKN